MTIDEAMKILHPDTTREALKEFDNVLEACNEACIIVCDTIKQLQTKIEMVTMHSNDLKKSRNNWRKSSLDKIEEINQLKAQLKTKETLLCLQETTMSLLSSDKDTLIHKTNELKAQLPIRCKDCELYDTNRTLVNSVVNQHFCICHQEYRKPNAFCDEAIRKVI